MDSQHKRLMEAFRTDCQTLITRFELSYNTHFQNFCEIWKDMQFSLIFAYRPNDTLFMEFCEEALSITKQFFVNATSLKECIGALYLMYGVYYKLPTSQLKIRMTQSDWKQLMDLHVKMKAEEYLDANYILSKLIVNRVFIHCISDNEFGIERHFHKKQAKPLLDFNLMPEIKELAEPGKLLSTISQLSKVYEEKKRALYANEEASRLQLFDTNVADDIISNIRTMQSESRIFAKCTPTPTESTVSKRSASTLNNENQKGQKRMRLRKNIILSKIGRAFESGLQSESEEEQNVDSEIDSLQDTEEKPADGRIMKKTAEPKERQDND